MKKNLFSLLSIACVILAGCSSNEKKTSSFSYSASSNAQSSDVSSSDIGSSSSDQSSTSQAPIELQDILAFDRDTTSPSSQTYGNKWFILKEFEDITFVLNGDKLLANEEVIEANLYMSSKYIYASDINKDGYRELIFDRASTKEENMGDLFVVYDVKNKQVLYDEADIRVGHYKFYKFNYEIREEKLVFFPYLGNYPSEENIVDFAYLRYTKLRGAYLEWQNINSIVSIDLEGFYIDDGNLTPVSPTKEGNKSIYTFGIGKRYLFKARFNRSKYDRQMNYTLTVYWDEKNPHHLINAEQVVNQDKMNIGLYQLYFSVVDECEALTWDFFYGEFSLKVNYRVVSEIK